MSSEGFIIVIIIILLLSSLSLSPLCRVFIHIFLRPTMSLGTWLSLLFMVSISLVPALYFYVSTFRSMCAVSNMAVFCSYFTSWFPGMLLMYFLNDYYYYYYYYYHHHHPPFFFYFYVYNCMPGTNHVSMVYSVAAVLYLQFLLHVMLFYI